MAEGFLLDTNIAIYAMRGEPDVLRSRMSECAEGSVFVSTISLSEIAVGYGEGVMTAPDVQALLGQVGAVPFDARAAAVYGTLPFKRARFDRLIAAHALALGLTLVTNDERDFADIPDLKLENWTQ